MVPLPQTDSAKAMYPTALANDTTSQIDRELCLQARREGDLLAGLTMQPQMPEVAIGYGTRSGAGYCGNGDPDAGDTRSRTRN